MALKGRVGRLKLRLGDDADERWIRSLPDHELDALLAEIRGTLRMRLAEIGVDCTMVTDDEIGALSGHYFRGDGALNSIKGNQNAQVR